MSPLSMTKIKNVISLNLNVYHTINHVLVYHKRHKTVHNPKYVPTYNMQSSKFIEFKGFISDTIYYDILGILLFLEQYENELNIWNLHQNNQDY